MRTLAQGLQEDLLFDRWRTYNFLAQVFRLDLTEANENEIYELANLLEVERMPCWPEQDSVKLIGDTIVIKLEEYS